MRETGSNETAIQQGRAHIQQQIEGIQDVVTG